jgi:hypothetical protein
MGLAVDSRRMDTRITNHQLWMGVDDTSLMSTTSPTYPQEYTPVWWIVGEAQSHVYITARTIYVILSTITSELSTELSTKPAIHLVL